MEEQKEQKIQRASFSIAGMTCAACVSMIQSVVGSEDGVLSVNINLLTNSGVVEFSEPATVPKIIEGIEDVCESSNKK